MTPLAAIALVALTVPFVALFRSDWVLRRLALRNPRRRPVESTLLVVGALFGTAIITASLLVGDTLDHSIASSAATSLGEVDELVTTRDPGVQASVAARLAPLAHDPAVDGVLPLLTAPVAVQLDTPSGARSAPGSKIIEVDFAAARAFGGGSTPSGLPGATPAAGQVVVSRRLADALVARTGDHLQVHVAGTDLTLTVRTVAEPRGLAGLSLDTLDRGRNLFVAPGTVDAALAASGGTDAASVQRSVAVSNTGGPLGGASRSAAVEAKMRDRLAGTPVLVRTVKADMVEAGKRTSAELGDLFLAMGAFGGLAGALLVVNLFVMLAEERKVQLGMFRALGMTRSALVRAFSAEGWIYGLAAATGGMLFGLGLGRAIIALVSASFDKLAEEGNLALVFHVDPASLRDGFLIGLGVSTATVVLASLRFAMVNIISAVRDLPSPRHARSPRWPLAASIVALAAGLAWSVAAFGSDNGVGIVVAPVLAAAGVAGLAMLRLPTRAVGTVLCVGAMAWATEAIHVVLSRVDEPDVTTFVAQGVLLTAAAVLLISLHQDRLGPLSRRLLRGPRSLVVALGVAYPLARKMRTALTVGMYALVVFTLAFITVLSSVFTSQLHRSATEMSGGADVLVRSPGGGALPVDRITARPDVRAVATLRQQPVLIANPADPTNPAVWFASTFDESLLRLGAPVLRDRGRYPTDEAAYRAVEGNDRLAVIDPLLAASLLQTHGRVGVGSRLTLLDPSSGTAREVEVAALAPTDLALNGILVGAPVAPAGTVLPATRALVASTSAGGASRLARAISDDEARAGAEAETFQSLVDRAAAAESGFFDLARGYLALGMVVGIAGLGVVLVRSVRERRRAIGVLRSLGVQPGPIGWSFILEAALMAVEGTVIGAGLGVFTAYSIMTSTSLVGIDVRFVLPALDVTVLVLLVVVISLLVTVVPARRASAIRPAVALRIAD